MAQTRYEAAEAIRRTNHGGGFPRNKNGISLSEKMFGYKQTSAAKFVNHGEEGVGGGRGHGKGPLAGIGTELRGQSLSPKVCSDLAGRVCIAA
jgi:hypothetical protein